MRVLEEWFLFMEMKRSPLCIRHKKQDEDSDVMIVVKIIL